MIKIKKKYFQVVSIAAGLLGISCLLFENTINVHADSDSAESAYSVSANIPEDQENKNVSYFDLVEEPNKERDISIHLANVGQKEGIFQVEVNNAATNSNGVIDYNQNSFKKDASAKYTVSDVLTPKSQEVALKAGEAKDVSFHVKMPKESFNGIILGGIHVTKKDNQSDKVAGTAIRNKYAYVIGVELRNNKNKVTPDLKLKAVKPGLQNSYATIFANLQNPTATIISKVNVNAVITKKGSDKSLYMEKKENLSVAPNTNFNFPIGLEKKKMDAGSYTLAMDVTEGNTQKKWHLQKDFTIKADKAKSINKEAVVEDTAQIPYLPIMIGVGLLLIGIIAWLSYKLLKQKGR